MGPLGGVPHRQPRPRAGHPEPVERRARTSASPPLRPDRVIEVAYDHMEGRRFRHTAHFRRWRTDRDPESCGYDQLDEPVCYDLTRLLSTEPGGES